MSNSRRCRKIPRTRSDKQCCLRTLRSVETLKKVKEHKKCTLKGKMLDVTFNNDNFFKLFSLVCLLRNGRTGPKSSTFFLLGPLHHPLGIERSISMLCYHQNAVLCVHAPRGHTLSFLAKNESKFIKPCCAGNGGRRSTFAGNSVLLPSDVIDFAMLPAHSAQRFWRETVSV